MGRKKEMKGEMKREEGEVGQERIAERVIWKRKEECEGISRETGRVMK